MTVVSGSRLRLREAAPADLGFILATQEAPENRDFIVAFSRENHLKAIEDKNGDVLDVIVEEKEQGEAVGYLRFTGLKSEDNAMEWTHIIINKKGLGYGREALRLMKKFTFETKKFHRGWLDCKPYNKVALGLYESEGLVREGLHRETILTSKGYEDLVVLGILEQEYRARKEQGREL